MLIIDSLIISGVRFVLDKVAAAVETELNDDTVLRERRRLRQPPPRQHVHRHRVLRRRC